MAASRTVTLNDGTKIPQLAFGTGSVWKGQDMTRFVAQALDAGFTHIDSAQYYQTETSVGAALAEAKLSREKLFITTKYSGLGTVTDAIQSSLKQLGVSYVDLYLIHNPSVVPDFNTVWRDIEGFRKAGLAKSIGVSNFAVPQLEKLLATAEVVPSVNQIRLHPYNYAAARPVLDFCAKKGIVVEAYSSLTPITATPGGPVDAPLQAAADRIGATPAQVIFKWLLAKGVIVVTTSSKKERLEEYLAVDDLPSLTDEEINAIEEAGAKGAIQPAISEKQLLADGEFFDLERAVAGAPAPRRFLTRDRLLGWVFTLPFGFWCGWKLAQLVDSLYA